MHTKVVNISEKLAQFSDHWNPRVIGELNGQQVKAAKLHGAFDFHHHENEDEMFLVIKGTLIMEFKDYSRTIRPGEFIIIPKGVSHKPVAQKEVEILLFEPAGTLNTGNVLNDRTVQHLEHL